MLTAVVHHGTGAWLAILAAGLVAGLMNGMAGGGTLLSFPILLALGYPAFAANVTNTVGIVSGYLAGAVGFGDRVTAQRGALIKLAAPSLTGAAVGAVLLLTTPHDTFATLAPVLVLVGATMFALQPLLNRRFKRAAGSDHQLRVGVGTALAVFLTSIYGAYFGAGLGVMLLAILGLTHFGPLAEINALRAVLSLLINLLSAVIFACAAPVAWGAVLALTIGAGLGGFVGARTSLRLPPGVLRAIVVVAGLATALRLLL